jgi:hypothetical protein
VKKNTFLVLIVLVLLINVCYATPAEIILGPARIYLGDDINTVVQKLQPNYILLKIKSDSDTYFVRSKDGPPYESLGSIQFQDGKVFRVVREWGNYQELTQAETIINLIEQVIKENRNDAFLDVKRTVSPTGSTLSLDIIFKTKQVNIIVFKSKAYGSSVIIEEKISVD